MKLTGKDLLKLINDNDLDTLTSLRDHIDEAIQIAINLQYVKVRIMNREGNSPEMHQKIEETLPQIQYRWHGEPGTIGEFELFIPRKMWNDETKTKCESLDSFVGHHVETLTKYVPKKDVEFPSRLQQLIKDRIEFLANQAKIYPNVKWKESDGAAWTSSEVEDDLRNYELRPFKKYLERVEYVNREWDESLRVSDWLNDANHAIKRIKDISIELN